MAPPERRGYRVTILIPRGTFRDLTRLIDFLVRTFPSGERDTTLIVEPIDDEQARP